MSNRLSPRTTIMLLYLISGGWRRSICTVFAKARSTSSFGYRGLSEGAFVSNTRNPIFLREGRSSQQMVRKVPYYSSLPSSHVRLFSASKGGDEIDHRPSEAWNELFESTTVSEDTAAEGTSARPIPPPLEYFGEEEDESGGFGALSYRPHLYEDDHDLVDNSSSAAAVPPGPKEDVPPPSLFDVDVDKANASVPNKISSTPSPTRRAQASSLPNDKVTSSSSQPRVRPRATSQFNEKMSQRSDDMSAWPPPEFELDETMSQQQQPPPATTGRPIPIQQTIPNKEADDFLVNASSGNGATTDMDLLTARLDQIAQEIYAQNNHKEFNINSPKQVSKVLFGENNNNQQQSTNKETLEAMGAAGNIMADLILQWRKCSNAIKRAKRKQVDRSNGTHVTNVSSMGRKKTTTTTSNNSQINTIADPIPEGQDPLLLVDASAYIFRAYYSMPPLHRRDGTPIGAVLGFCNMLNRLVLTRLLNGECPRLVLVFDTKGDTFRHDLYPEYKANRKECPMDLIPQFDLIREAAEAYGIQQIEAPNYEADDVIATLTTMALEEGVDINILSGDKDLMQLVTEDDAIPGIHMIDPMKMSRITHDVVIEKWGVEPALVGDVLALAGDSSDNIPGIPSIGPKTAAKLLSEYGNLETVLEQAENITRKGWRTKIIDNTDKARLSRKLVELERQIPIENMTYPENLDNVANLRMEAMDTNRLLDFYENMGFKDLKRRFQDRLTQRDRKQKAGGSAIPAAAAKKGVGKTSRPWPKKKTEIPRPEDYDEVPF